jgi:hypothetical protein
VALRVVEDEQEDTVEDEEAVLEEDLSDEEADSAGPVKWVVPSAPTAPPTMPDDDDMVYEPGLMCALCFKNNSSYTPYGSGSVSTKVRAINRRHDTLDC